MTGAVEKFTAAGPRGLFDAAKVRSDFPALSQRVHGKPLVYLDSAATSQKPRIVIDSVADHYTNNYSNIHRGVHYLSERATQDYEAAREKAARFINARESREVIFVRGTTEAVNLVAQTFGRSLIRAGDEILLTEMEHHSNIVPWQMLCEQSGAVLRVAPIDDKGELIVEEFERLLNPRTRLAAITHVSNALGTVNPVRELVQMAHAHGAKVLVDGAQAAPHMEIDVQALGCDFYAFSGHKAYGPTGIGVLYGRAALLEAIPPYQGGGDMIREVTFAKTTYADLPYKFEAGTPHIVGAIGLGVAIDYLQALGLESVARYEHDLLEYATHALSSVPDLRLVGTAARKAGIVSFVLSDIHAHDIGTILDHEGVAVRAGHHCAMPIMQRLGLAATVRASLGLYNTRADVDILVKALHRAREVFGA